MLEDLQLINVVIQVAEISLRSLKKLCPQNCDIAVGDFLISAPGLVEFVFDRPKTQTGPVLKNLSSLNAASINLNNADNSGGTRVNYCMLSGLSHATILKLFAPLGEVFSDAFGGLIFAFFKARNFHVTAF